MLWFLSRDAGLKFTQPDFERPRKSGGNLDRKAPLQEICYV